MLHIKYLKIFKHCDFKEFFYLNSTGSKYNSKKVECISYKIPFLLATTQDEMLLNIEKLLNPQPLSSYCAILSLRTIFNHNT